MKIFFFSNFRTTPPPPYSTHTKWFVVKHPDWRRIPKLVIHFLKILSTFPHKNINDQLRRVFTADFKSETFFSFLFHFLFLKKILSFILFYFCESAKIKVKSREKCSLIWSTLLKPVKLLLQKHYLFQWLIKNRVY